MFVVFIEKQANRHPLLFKKRKHESFKFCNKLLTPYKRGRSYLYYVCLTLKKELIKILACRNKDQHSRKIRAKPCCFRT